MATSKQKKKFAQERRKPFLQFCVLCDAVGQVPGGKAALIGVFSLFLRPARVPQFHVATCWADGVGSFKQTIRILKPNLEELLSVKNSAFELKNRVESSTVITGLVGVDFTTAGVYWVEVYLENDRVMSIPLPVRENVLGLK